LKDTLKAQEIARIMAKVTPYKAVVDEYDKKRNYLTNEEAKIGASAAAGYR